MITEALPTSEPVPAVVGTAIIGIILFVSALVHQLPISSFAFAPRSNRLASGSRDGSLAIWGLKDDGHGGISGFSHMTDHISTIAWKKDEKALAAGDANGKVKTWKIKT